MQYVQIGREMWVGPQIRAPPRSQWEILRPYRNQVTTPPWHGSYCSSINLIRVRRVKPRQ